MNRLDVVDLDVDLVDVDLDVDLVDVDLDVDLVDVHLVDLGRKRFSFLLMLPCWRPDLRKLCFSKIETDFFSNFSKNLKSSLEALDRLYRSE